MWEKIKYIIYGLMGWFKSLCIYLGLFCIVGVSWFELGKGFEQNEYGVFGVIINLVIFSSILYILYGYLTNIDYILNTEKNRIETKKE